MPQVWQPIINSKLDTDTYKCTMGQLVFDRYPNTPVVYRMKNRTKGIRIADFVDEDELRRELDHFREIPLRNTERHYLETLTFSDGQRVYQRDYLDFFQTLMLPPYDLKKENGEYVLAFPGKWSEAIYWESPALAIVTELTYRGIMKQQGRTETMLNYTTGAERLLGKLKMIQQYPGIRFMEFGTRRRFGRDWQDYCLATAKTLVPQQLLGTSNLLLAMKHDLKPLGTFAHELYMAFACIYNGNDNAIRESHGRVLDEWEKEYGPHLLTALTDVFGSAFFFSDFRERAARWSGLRQDSGDPHAFGEAAIRFYEDLDIDPKTKTVLFSDGLQAEEIIRLYLSFQNRIPCVFGWGTNLTNDLGFPPISLVIKLIECCGHPAVKLSDNLAKATGPAEEIERYKTIFRYTGTLYEPCTY